MGKFRHAQHRNKRAAVGHGIQARAGQAEYTVHNRGGNPGRLRHLQVGTAQSVHENGQSAGAGAAGGRHNAHRQRAGHQRAHLELEYEVNDLLKSGRCLDHTAEAHHSGSVDQGNNAAGRSLVEGWNDLGEGKCLAVKDHRQ